MEEEYNYRGNNSCCYIKLILDLVDVIFEEPTVGSMLKERSIKQNNKVEAAVSRGQIQGV